MHMDRIQIERKGIAQKAAMMEEQSISFGMISAINIKKPGLTNGYIEFVYPGTMPVLARDLQLPSQMALSHNRRDYAGRV